MADTRAPGVYLTEGPLSTPPNEIGNATAVGVFVGAANKGPLDTPVRISKWNDFVSTFGAFERVTGTDASISVVPTKVYVRKMSSPTPGADNLGGITDALRGDIAFVNAYRGTLSDFYRRNAPDSAQPGYSAPHEVWVYTGTAWVNSGYKFRSNSPLFDQRSTILGVDPAVSIVVVDRDPTTTAPLGISPKFGDIALRWDSVNDRFDTYVYGHDNTRYFTGSGGTEGVVSIAMSATGGTFTITINGETTGTIAYNASATAVGDALASLPSIDPEDFVVTKPTGTTFRIAAAVGGAFEDVAFPPRSISTAGLTGGSAVLTVVEAGGSSHAKGSFDSTYTDDDSVVALPEGWNRITFDSQKSASPGMDFQFSTDPSTVWWGPLADSATGTPTNQASYVSFVSFAGIPALADWEPTFPSAAGSNVEAVSYLPYAVYAFFQNGGRSCYVVRSYDHDSSGANAALEYFNSQNERVFSVAANGAGSWGNKLGVIITSAPVGQSVSSYTLRVYLNEGTIASPAWREVERFTDLTMVSDLPGLKRFDTIVNDPILGSKYLKLVDFVAAGSLTSPDSALTPDASNSPVRALGAGPNSIPGTDPGIPGSNDFRTSAVEATPQINEPVILNVSGLTTNVNDHSAFRSALLHTGLFGPEVRDDLFIVNDGYPPRLGRPIGNYLTTCAALSNANTRDDSRVADYFPWVWMGDPAVTGGQKLVPPGGAIVGKMSGLEALLGVHVSPAGTRSTLSVLDVETPLTQTQLGQLNNEHVNSIVAVQGNGYCAMGARTRKFYGPDRYINVRRTLIFVETMLRTSTSFAVFENNDDRLWGRLRVTAESILNPLWAAGALKGVTAAEAFYIQCDETTNSPQTIAAGEVRMNIGVALQVPAEFVIIHVAQIDGVVTAAVTA